MKKLISLFAIFSIVISVTFLFPCNTGSFCCADDLSPTSQCSTCTPHIKSNYATENLHPIFILSPSLVGHIFFQYINAEQLHVVFSPDRPPAIIS